MAVRSARHGDDRPGQAIVSGFRTSARVVVAALIMMAVFAGFVGASESMIKMIGFGLAAAVLFDAFVVRMAIVPAVLSLLGDRAWRLPRRLDRLLPSIDVEGEAITRKHPLPSPPVDEHDPELVHSSQVRTRWSPPPGGHPQDRGRHGGRPLARRTRGDGDRRAPGPGGEQPPLAAGHFGVHHDHRGAAGEAS